MKHNATSTRFRPGTNKSQPTFLTLKPQLFMKKMLHFVFGPDRKDGNAALPAMQGNSFVSRRAVILMALACLTSFSVNATTNTSTGSGDWNNAAIWDQGHVPLAGEDVIVANGHVVNLNINTTLLSSITISGELKATVSNRTVNVSGNVIGSGLITTMPNTSIIIFDFDGDWVFSGTGPSGNINRTSIKIDGTGNQTLGGSLQFYQIKKWAMQFT